MAQRRWVAYASSLSGDCEAPADWRNGFLQSAAVASCFVSGGASARVAVVDDAGRGFSTECLLRRWCADRRWGDGPTAGSLPAIGGDVFLAAARHHHAQQHAGGALAQPVRRRTENCSRVGEFG